MPEVSESQETAAGRKRLICILGCFALVTLAAVASAVLWARTNETRKQMTLCVHQLRMLDRPLHVYAQSHGGAVPSRISELYPEYVADPRLFMCPNVAASYLSRTGQPHPLLRKDVRAAGIDEHSSFVLTPGAMMDGSRDIVVASERGDNHHGRGRAVLFADGRGGWDPPVNWR